MESDFLGCFLFSKSEFDFYELYLKWRCLKVKNKNFEASKSE
jgi:hypothetical protein